MEYISFINWLKKLSLSEYLIAVLLIFVSQYSCRKNEPAKFNPDKYVDPFIGTSAHGHTFPGQLYLSAWFN